MDALVGLPLYQSMTRVMTRVRIIGGLLGRSLNISLVSLASPLAHAVEGSSPNRGDRFPFAASLCAVLVGT